MTPKCEVKVTARQMGKTTEMMKADRDRLRAEVSTLKAKLAFADDSVRECHRVYHQDVDRLKAEVESLKAELEQVKSEYTFLMNGDQNDVASKQVLKERDALRAENSLLASALSAIRTRIDFMAHCHACKSCIEAARFCQWKLREAEKTPLQDNPPTPNAPQATEEKGKP